MNKCCKCCYWYSPASGKCDYENGESFHVDADDECHITYTDAFDYIYEFEDEENEEDEESEF